MKYYIDAFKKYAVFSGRARRSEFWFFTLFNLIAAFIAGVIAALISIPSGWNEQAQTGLADLYLLVALLPSIAVSVRRLHDTGRSGWWLLISLVPLVGTLVLLVFYIEDSKPGPNRFGPNPKGVNPALPQNVVA